MPPPGLNDLAEGNIHEDLGKRAAFGISVEMIRLFVPGEAGIQHHRQKQVVAVVDHDELPAGALQGGVVDEVFFGAVGADVALQGEFPRDDLLDGDLLVPAVATVPLVAAGLGDLLRAAERAFGLGHGRFA